MRLALRHARNNTILPHTAKKEVIENKYPYIIIYEFTHLFIFKIKIPLYKKYDKNPSLRFNNEKIPLWLF